MNSQNNQELIQKAERCEWSLDCDEKLLQIMQSVASVRKILEKFRLISLNQLSNRSFTVYRKLKAAARTPKPT